MSTPLRLSLIASALLLAACGRGTDGADDASTAATDAKPAAGEQVVYVYNCGAEPGKGRCAARPSRTRR